MTTRTPQRAPLIPPCIIYAIIQMIVTISLLGFAYALRSYDRTISTVVVTAVVAHWLKEGPVMGTLVSRGVEEWSRGRREDRDSA